MVIHRRRGSPKKAIEEFVRQGQEAPLLSPACLTRWGWSHCLNQADGNWIFSAKLHPPGRSSTENDWNRVGRTVALVYEATGYDPAAGEPTLLTPLEETPPNATHYWMWPVKEPA